MYPSSPKNSTTGTPGGKTDILRALGSADGVPPNSLDAEVAVLGGAMLERSAMDMAANILPDPAMFFRRKHQSIWAAMLELYEAGQPVDIITLNDALRRAGTLAEIGGSTYLSELGLRTPTAANMGHHARIVYEHHMRRKLIEVALGTVASVLLGIQDPFTELDRARSGLDSILGAIPTRGIDEVYDRNRVLVEVGEAIFDPSKRPVIRTGLRALDAVIGGARPGELIVIAGRPGSGKSALAISMAMNIAGLMPGVGLGEPEPCVIFELEMARLQVWYRVIGTMARIDVSRFGRSGNIWTPDESSRINNAITRLEKSRFYIQTTSKWTLPTLRRRMEELVGAGKCKIAFVDYAGKLTPPRGHSKSDEVEYIAAELKALAKDLNIPVVALFQLNRECEKRFPPRPRLSDLRDSGAIEQEADIVGMCYRPEYYKTQFPDIAYEDGTPIEGLGDVQIEKNRNGAVGHCRLAYLKEFTRWDNLTGIHAPAYPAGYTAATNPF